MSEPRSPRRKKKVRTTELRGDWRIVWAGKLAGVLLKLLGLTLRYRKLDVNGELERLADVGRPVIYCLWHNLMIPGLLTARQLPREKLMVLTSASKDGAGLAALAESLGCGAVRGSSSRRGLQALMELKRELGGGRDVAITPDGPRGPRYNLQPGVLKLAQSTGVPLILLRCECSSAWKLKTWDRLRIPKPFSSVTMTAAAMVEVPRRLTEEEFEAIRVDVERQLLEGVEDPISNHEQEH